MPYIPTEPVESSNIDAIGYDHRTQTLRIIFHGGRAYDYPMVLEREYRLLMEAESKGRFFNGRIKPMYAHRTPRPEELQPPVCDDTCADPCPRHGSEDEEIKDACSDHPDGCPEDCPVEPDRESVTAMQDDLIDGVCRCCRVPVKIVPEDAVELCLACYRGKGGDTDEPCTFGHPDCPHGADGQTCEEGCSCAPCHQRFVAQAPVDVDPTCPPPGPSYPGPSEQSESD